VIVMEVCHYRRPTTGGTPALRASLQKKQETRISIEVC